MFRPDRPPKLITPDNPGRRSRCSPQPGLSHYGLTAPSGRVWVMMWGWPPWVDAGDGEGGSSAPVPESAVAAHALPAHSRLRQPFSRLVDEQGHVRGPNKAAWRRARELHHFAFWAKAPAVALRLDRVRPHGDCPAKCVASEEKWMANDFPSGTKLKLYDSIINTDVWQYDLDWRRRGRLGAGHCRHCAVAALNVGRFGGILEQITFPASLCWHF